MSKDVGQVHQAKTGGRRWGVREFLLTATAVTAMLAIGATMQMAARGGPADKPETITLAQASATAGPDAEQMKAMTEAVLRSLGAVTGGGAAPVGRKAQPRAQQAPQDYAQLVQALSSIVQKATLEGRNTQEIMALIDEALAEQDQALLEALLQQAGGKVGLQKLLVALVQRAATEGTENDPYVKALQAEGTATRVAATEGRPGAARQMGTGEAGRTIVVRPGDTLSTIASRVYGSASRWRLIFEANRDKLRDPDFVRVGMRLRLP